MKILHVGKFYHPYVGGIETVLQNLAEGLVERSHRVTVYCSNTNTEFKVGTINGVDVVRAPTYGHFASQPLTFGLHRLIVENSYKFDLINIHSPNPLVELSVLGLNDKVPVVVTYHSDIVRQKFLKNFYNPIQHQVLTRANGIVAASPQLVKYSEVLSHFQTKCRVIPFGLPKATFTPTSSLKEKADPYILFVGRLVSYKGLEVLLQAMTEVSAKLLIVGEGPLKKNLQNHIQKLGLHEKVQLMGRVEDQNTLMSLMQGCELFVLPSITTAEAFGMVLLEAMACGKPIVSTKLESGVSFVNEHGVTGYQVPPQNPVELAQAITKILANPLQKEMMGRASRERFDKYFTREAMVKSYEDLYLKLTEGVERVVAA